jgi:hypothetical protein
MSSLVITKETGNFFSLVLDNGDPIISEQNRLTTVGDFCNFKTANGANLILKQNILYSEITIITSGSHVPTSIQDLWLSLITEGFFYGLGNSGSGTGAERFTELLDTFSSYLGRDGQVLVVNESQQRIETIAVSIFSAADRNKLDNIESNAEVNVQANWNETNPNSDAFILNKPPINSIGVFTTRFTPTGQICTLPTGATAVSATIDGYIQYLEQAGFETDINTFTQTGDDVTFKTTLDGTPQILIQYYL